MSEPVRRRELRVALSSDWTSTTALGKAVGVQPQGLQKHLRELEREGVVERRGRGVVGAPREWRLVPQPEVRSA